MWTPLILVCMTASPTDCAIPLAPAVPTEEACVAAIYNALRVITIPDTMYVEGVQCVPWGQPA